MTREKTLKKKRKPQGSQDERRHVGDKKHHKR
jgi:hypothetical protein